MHRPTNEEEATRVISAGGKITGERTKRINGTLSLLLSPRSSFSFRIPLLCPILPLIISTGQLVVTRALGDHFMKKNSKGLISVPHVNDDVLMKPENNSILVIASDGVNTPPLSFFLLLNRSARPSSSYERFAFDVAFRISNFEFHV
jgi:hypothetical protein